MIGLLHQMTQPDPLMEQPDRSARWYKWLSRAAILCLALTSLVILFDSMSALPQRFDYAHGWVSAHFATSARTFAEHGVFALHAIPIVNNPPFGVAPEAYIHWPPLFSIALAWLYAAFGESETTSHGPMLFVNFVNAALLAVLAKKLWGSAAAIVAALAWLSMPVVVTYAHLIWNLPLALSFLLLALIAFQQATAGSALTSRWAIAGCIAMSMAVGTSWEPIMACPGLLAAAWWNGRRYERNLAIAYTASNFFSGRTSA